MVNKLCLQVVKEEAAKSKIHDALVRLSEMLILNNQDGKNKSKEPLRKKLKLSLTYFE